MGNPANGGEPGRWKRQSILIANLVVGAVVAQTTVVSLAPGEELAVASDDGGMIDAAGSLNDELAIELEFLAWVRRVPIVQHGTRAVTNVHGEPLT